MLDEEMDHIIRDAADNHYPAYNDKAWEKMRIQLDKHLPQKKDRKKFIFFLLFFLLLGGGLFFAVFQLANNKNSTNNSGIEYTQNKQSGSASVTADTTTTGVNIENAPGNTPKNKISDNSSNYADNTLPPENNSATEVFAKSKNLKVIREGSSNMKITAANPTNDFVQGRKPVTKNNMPPAGKNINGSDKMNIVISAEPESNESENSTAVPADLNNEKNKTAEQKNDTAKVNEDKKEKEMVVTENKTTASPDKKKQKKNVAGNFGITFSAGPDLSFVQLNKLGKATLMYGAGLSYNFKKRITVRAGFYSSKKIYTAAPDQYNAPIYPNLTEIYADCRVYEIPVSLSYNFWQRKNHNWFGSAGLSSFLMKNEKYDYRYKTTTGYTYNYKREVSNENKHYFAVLTLSGGYQYQLSKRISIQAEPYLKLPLSGIGLGKIKLNSSGILFTLTVKPFAKGR